MKNKLILAALFLLILLVLFLLQSSARPQTFPNAAQHTASQTDEVGWDPHEFDPSLDVDDALYGMVMLDLIVACAVSVAAAARRSRPLCWRSDFISINSNY